MTVKVIDDAEITSEILHIIAILYIRAFGGNMLELCYFFPKIIWLTVLVIRGYFHTFTELLFRIQIRK